MRVLIVSDTHGKHENLEKVLEIEDSFDRVFHLGDAQVTKQELESLTGCPVDVVAGNMDFRSEAPSEKLVEIEDYTVFLCHGHRYHVNETLLTLEYAARSKGADVVLYGHTHVPFLDESEDLWIMNPGSLSEPRPWKASPSYGVLNIDEMGEISLEHRYLE